MKRNVAAKKSARPVGRPRLHEGRGGTGSTKDDIIQAASELFAVKGYAGTSIREIAEGAGLTKTALYHYFAKKEDILDEMIQDVMLPPLELQRRLSRERVSPGVKLFSYLRFDMRQLCAAPYDYTWFLTMRETRQPRYRTFWDERRDLVRWVERVLRAGMKSGEFIRVEAPTATQMLFTVDEYSVAAFRRDSKKSPAAFAQITAELAVRSVLRRPDAIASIVKQADEVDGRLQAGSFAGAHWPSK